jgi:hypothetical protein
MAAKTPAKAIAKLEPEFEHNQSCTAQLEANSTHCQVMLQDWHCWAVKMH